MEEESRLNKMRASKLRQIRLLMKKRLTSNWTVVSALKVSQVKAHCVNTGWERTFISERASNIGTIQEHWLVLRVDQAQRFTRKRTTSLGTFETKRNTLWRIYLNVGMTSGSCGRRRNQLRRSWSGLRRTDTSCFKRRGDAKDRRKRWRGRATTAGAARSDIVK